MSYLGSWKIDDLLTWYVNTHTPSTSGVVDADAVPGYRIYEDETGTPLLTGSMALLDDANTTGFYSEQITLSAANGFEKGKCYCIRTTGVVASVTAAHLDNFQIEAEVDSNAVSNLNANVITATAINTGAITSAKFAAGAIDAAAIATDAIDADAIADNAINAGAIATGAITSAKFAAGAIDAAAIATDAIDADAIADNAINAGAIATGAITSAKFAAGAIDAAAIATDAIDADAIATDAVTEIAGGIADAVWDEARSGHTTSGTYGEGDLQVYGSVGVESSGRLNVQAWLEDSGGAVANATACTMVVCDIDGTTCIANADWSTAPTENADNTWYAIKTGGSGSLTPGMVYRVLVTITYNSIAYPRFFAFNAAL